MASIDRTAAAELFQEAVAPRVAEKATESSVVLGSLPVIPMGDKVMRMPVLSALPTAAFLTADQDVKPTSVASWDKVLLTAEEVAVIVPISETVIADSSIDVVAKVTDLIAQEFGRVVDAAALFGTGAPASWPSGGLYGIADTASQTVQQSAVVADDWNDLFAELEEIGYDVTDVFATKRVKSILRGQKDGNDSPLYVPTQGGAGVGEVYGVPVKYPSGGAWSDADVLALAVDRSTVTFGLRQDVTIKILSEATLTGFGNLAEKDSIAVRAVMRVGFAVANPVTLDTGDQEYGVAALNKSIVLS